MGKRKSAAVAPPSVDLQTLTIAAAARRLGISRTTLLKAIEVGDVPTVQIAGLRRVSVAALQKMVAA